MKIFAVCLAALTVASVAVAKTPSLDGSKQFETRITLQRPGAPDQKPTIRSLERQKATLKFGQKPEDTLEITVSLTSGTDHISTFLSLKADSVSFNSGFAVVMPAAQFTLSIAKDAKGDTVARFLGGVQKTFTFKIGNDWSRYAGTQLLFDSTVVADTSEKP